MSADEPDADIPDPDDAFDVPAIPPGCGDVWRDFWQLQPERNYAGMGSPLPLQLAALKLYADTYRPDLASDRGDFVLWVRLIRACDMAWLAETAKKLERERGRGGEAAQTGRVPHSSRRA